jgi:hypothetical protein
MALARIENEEAEMRRHKLESGDGVVHVSGKEIVPEDVDSDDDGSSPE